MLQNLLKTGVYLLKKRKVTFWYLVFIGQKVEVLKVEICSISRPWNTFLKFENVQLIVNNREFTAYSSSKKYINIEGVVMHKSC